MSDVVSPVTYDFDVLAIRRRLGRDRWGPPKVGPFGHGVTFARSDGRRSIMVSSSPMTNLGDLRTWVHASISAHPESAPLPEYEELKMLRHAVWGDDGWAFQVFAPEDSHVNIRANALHLWGLLDGSLSHPNFGWAGTI